jgi:hypothetical protein
MTDRLVLSWDSHRRAGKNLGWLDSARRDALCDERGRLNMGSQLLSNFVAHLSGKVRATRELFGVDQDHIMVAVASAINTNSASRAFVYPIRIPTVISRDPSAREDYHST